MTKQNLDKPDSFFCMIYDLSGPAGVTPEYRSRGNTEQHCMWPQNQNKLENKDIRIPTMNFTGFKGYNGWNQKGLERNCFLKMYVYLKSSWTNGTWTWAEEMGTDMALQNLSRRIILISYKTIEQLNVSTTFYYVITLLRFHFDITTNSVSISTDTKQ